jgi:hypothetical protein
VSLSYSGMNVAHMEFISRSVDAAPTMR